MVPVAATAGHGMAYFSGISGIPSKTVLKPANDNLIQNSLYELISLLSLFNVRLYNLPDCIIHVDVFLFMH